jgi:hypothetical protein
METFIVCTCKRQYNENMTVTYIVGKEMQNTQFIDTIAIKFGLSAETIRQLTYELEKTRGRSARFDIKELGGKGRWELNQTASVGNGFNAALNTVVTDLCTEISERIREGTQVEEDATLPSTRKKAQPELDDTIGLTTISLKPGAWWSEHYGNDPEKTGSVSGMRFAYFAQHRRLILRQGLRNRIFDTEDYNVQDVVAGKAPGFFNIIVQTIEGNLLLTDLTEVAR